jgi:hypothetical protein
VFAYDVSVPSGIPPGVEGRIVQGDALDLTLPSLHVWMQVRNHTSSTTVPHKNLGILLWIESGSAHETFSFDPGHVVLKFQDGEVVQLTSYGGPDLLRVNPRAAGPSCGWASQRLEVKAPRGPISFTWRACFLLLFDTSASPDRSFTLVIEELKKAGEYVSIPPVEFKRGSVRKYQQVL